MSGPPGLLEQLLNNEVDPDYRNAADVHGSAARTRSTVRSLSMVATVAVFGILLAVAAVKTERDRPQALVERTELIASIHSGEHKLDALHTMLRTLQSDVADLQSRLAALSDSQTRLRSLTATLGVAAGTAPVRGPGLVITADNAPNAVPGAGGVIRDSDLQVLINGLWAAGAEAVSVNGHRLTTLTAIRFAGQAITVDYRSLKPPYVVEAIGNPDSLPARFLETQGGQVWTGLQANFGIRFQTHSRELIELTGDPHQSLMWAHAQGHR